MLLSVLSALIVSIDAFFIGLSLGLQEKCKFIYLAVINGFLFALCLLGYFTATFVYEQIPFDPDIIVGIAFISLGLWCILSYFIFHQGNASRKSIVIVGLVMSLEAMLITMGITLIFMPYSTLLIPLTVAAAHFGYSAITFCLARTRHAKRFSPLISHTISGLALIAYGVIALVV